MIISLDPHIIIIIILTALMQSLLGIGILFLGTPILISQGYDYVEVLKLLLPISMTISFINSYRSRNYIEIDLRIIFLIVPILFLMYMTLDFSSTYIEIFISLMLILSGGVAILDLSKHDGVKERLDEDYKNSNVYFQNNKSFFQYSSNFIIGILHGLSNMGGGLLVWFYNRMFSEKNKIRAMVAFSYGLMAMSQISVLLVKKETLNYNSTYLILLLVSVMIFYASGAIFKRIESEKYSLILNVLIVFMGLIMIIRTLFV